MSGSQKLNPDAMQTLPRARTPGAIVYLAQKRHSSYGRDSIGLLTRSLRLLFENYNDAYRDDVLVFHEGEFTPSDQASIIDGRAPIRFARLPTRYWSMPPTLRINQSTWEQPRFTLGYRHMMRWYARPGDARGTEVPPSDTVAASAPGALQPARRRAIWLRRRAPGLPAPMSRRVSASWPCLRPAQLLGAARVAAGATCGQAGRPRGGAVGRRHTAHPIEDEAPPRVRPARARLGRG